MSASARASWVTIEGRVMLKVSTEGEQETHMYFCEATAIAVVAAIVGAGDPPIDEQGAEVAA